MKAFSIRTRAAAAVAACALALTACSSAGGDGGGSKLIKEGELVVAMSGEFQPFSFFDKDSKLTGFDYDISVAVADELGLELKTETAAISSLVQGLKSHRYDALIASMSATDKRKKEVDFTEPYYSSGAQYFVRNDSDCAEFDLKSTVKVGVANGTTYAEYLTDNGFAGEVVSFESDSIALEDTEAGRLDGTITDLLVGLYQLKEAGRDMRPCGEPLYTEGPAIAVAKGSALKGEIDGALVKIKENGTYADISNKWFGEDIS